jgi:hypothetical protein
MREGTLQYKREKEVARRGPAMLILILAGGWTRWRLAICMECGREFLISWRHLEQVGEWADLQLLIGLPVHKLSG